eukprot:9903251-Alexandrium_andersonii.AAC.1
MPSASRTAAGCASRSVRAAAKARGGTTPPPSPTARRSCPNALYIRRACLAAEGESTGAGV